MKFTQHKKKILLLTILISLILILFVFDTSSAPPVDYTQQVPIQQAVRLNSAAVIDYSPTLIHLQIDDFYNSCTTDLCPAGSQAVDIDINLTTSSLQTRIKQRIENTIAFEQHNLYLTLVESDFSTYALFEIGPLQE